MQWLFLCTLIYLASVHIHNLLFCDNSISHPCCTSTHAHPLCLPSSHCKCGFNLKPTTQGYLQQFSPLSPTWSIFTFSCTKAANIHMCCYPFHLKNKWASCDRTFPKPFYSLLSSVAKLLQRVVYTLSARRLLPFSLKSTPICPIVPLIQLWLGSLMPNWDHIQWSLSSYLIWPINCMLYRFALLQMWVGLRETSHLLFPPMGSLSYRHFVATFKDWRPWEVPPPPCPCLLPLFCFLSFAMHPSIPRW